MLAPHDPVREILRAHLLSQVSPHQRHAHEPPVHSRHSQVLLGCVIGVGFIHLLMHRRFILMRDLKYGWKRDDG